MIKALNKKRKTKPKELTLEPFVCEGNSCTLLEDGTKVRVKLDNPINYVDEKRLHGTFRASDIRWSCLITQYTIIFSQ